jgi:hypothetical protein
MFTYNRPASNVFSPFSTGIANGIFAWNFDGNSFCA